MTGVEFLDLLPGRWHGEGVAAVFTVEGLGDGVGAGGQGEDGVAVHLDRIVDDESRLPELVFDHRLE